jgi:hypothetical protein
LNLEENLLLFGAEQQPAVLKRTVAATALMPASVSP